MRFGIIFSVVLCVVLSGSVAWAQQEPKEEKKLSVVIIEELKLSPGKELPPGFMSQMAYVRKEVELNPGAIATKFREFLEALSSVVSAAPDYLGPFSTDEIEVSVEMNAEGGFSLIGKATVGATTGIKIKLKRKQP